MWFPLARRDDPPDRRVSLWLRVLEVLLTALILAVTLWRVLAGGP